MTRARVWWVPAATGIAGLAAGLFLGGRDDGPVRVEERGSAPETTVGFPAGERGLTAEDIRRVVREELAARYASSQATNAPAVPEPPTAAQSAAASQAQSVLETAIAKRNWGDTDAEALRAVFDQLSPDQQAEVLRQYAQAVNQGRLVPQTDRVPF